jgi:DNA-binding response OmpR family regulator
MHADVSLSERSPAPQPVAFGALVLDPTGFCVRVSDQDVPMTLSEFLILRELVTAPYRTFSRVELAAAVQSRSESAGGAPASARAIDLHVSRLRRKLRQAGFDGIRTMKSVGYRFVPQRVSATSMPAAGAG